MRGVAAALVVVAVTSADDATAQVLDRASQPPASALPAAGWTDHPIRPGVTSIKAVHFDELRARFAALRAREGLAPVRWTDPGLTPGAPFVSRVHVAELRAALGGVYDARGQLQPVYTDRTLTTGRTLVRAAHVMELRGGRGSREPVAGAVLHAAPARGHRPELPASWSQLRVHGSGRRRERGPRPPGLHLSYE